MNGGWWRCLYLSIYIKYKYGAPQLFIDDHLLFFFLSTSHPLSCLFFLIQSLNLNVLRLFKMAFSRNQDNIAVDHSGTDYANVVRDEKDIDIGHVERTISAGDLDKRDHMDYDRVDKEVAAYTNDTAIHISEEESLRLRKKVDKRVLFVMIVTYFLQAIDKGTLSFSAIMGIREDTRLHGQQVSNSLHV